MRFEQSESLLRLGFGHGVISLWRGDIVVPELAGGSMISRRSFLFASLAVVATPSLASSHSGKAFIIPLEFQPQRIDNPGHAAGTLVVDTGNRQLVLVETHRFAIRYPIAVGRAGLAFKGAATVDHKAKWPSWRPTQNMIRRNPKRYARFAKGVAGGRSNPLGARALYLYRDGRDTMYRIHGTNEPSSIGRAVSNGCIRMFNEHVEDLYERVPLGTKVFVL